MIEKLKGIKNFFGKGKALKSEDSEISESEKNINPDSIKVIKVSYSTNTGCSRDENQDNFYVDSVGRKLQENISGTKIFNLNKRRIFAVFDGMGGEAFGSEASEIAASCLVDYVDKIKLIDNDNLSELIFEYVEKANSEICDMTLEKRCGISGSTLALVCVDERYVKGYSLGDSKIYLYNGANISQVNEDQTLAAQKIKAQIYTEEEARNSGDNSKLTMFLGVDMVKKGLKPLSYNPIKLHNNIFILCSDGVSNACSYEEMIEVIKQNDGNKAEQLTERAIKNGSDDNVTCIVIENIS